MTNYNYFDENFKFLFRSLKDKELKKDFDLEVKRAIDNFFKWYINGNTPFEAEIKVKNSYGLIIGDMAIFYIYNNFIKI